MGPRPAGRESLREIADAKKRASAPARGCLDVYGGLIFSAANQTGNLLGTAGYSVSSGEGYTKHFRFPYEIVSN